MPKTKKQRKNRRTKQMQRNKRELREKKIVLARHKSAYRTENPVLPSRARKTRKCL